MRDATADGKKKDGSWRRWGTFSAGLFAILAAGTAHANPVQYTVTDIGILPGYQVQTEADAINNSGQVVGYSQNSSGRDRAFLYSAGSMSDLGTLSSLAIQTVPYSVNDSGQVVGYSQISSGDRAFRYSSGTMSDLGALPYYNLGSYALGINNSGEVVGISGTSAFVWTASSGIQDLNNLISTSPRWKLAEATGINDVGQICGYGISPRGQSRAFLLTPVVSEPPTLAIFSADALGVCGYLWRWRRQKPRNSCARHCFMFCEQVSEICTNNICCGVCKPCYETCETEE